MAGHEKHSGTHPVHAKSKKHKNNLFSKILVTIGLGLLLIVLTIGMLFWGNSSGGDQTQQQSIVFGTYNNVPIDTSSNSYFMRQAEYYSQLLNYQAQAQQQDPQTMTYQIYKYAFDSTVIHLAALEEAQKAGLTVSDTKINELMKQRYEFMENSVFSPKKYLDTPSSTVAQIRKQVLEDAIVQEYMSIYRGSKTSSKEASFIKAMPSKERAVEFVAFRFSDYPDAELKAYADKNAELFSKLTLSRITFTTEADAKKALSELNAKTKTFEEAVAAYSKDSFKEAKGVEGTKWFFDLKDELKNAEDAGVVAKLAKDALSAPIASKDGNFVIFKNDADVKALDSNDKDTLVQVKSYISKSEKSVFEAYYTAKANDFKAAATINFDSACKTFGLEKKTSASFPLNYGDVEYFKKVNAEGLPELTGVSTNDKFFSFVFGKEVGSVSEPFVLNDLILVAKIASEVDADAATIESIPQRLDIQNQNSYQNELVELMMSSPLLKDNFTTTFVKYFISNN